MRLLDGVPNDQLSPAEEDVLDRVFAQYGHMGRYQIRDFTHTLPEWTDPHGSSIPIRVKDVLLAQGVCAEDAAAIEEALDAEAQLNQVVG